MIMDTAEELRSELRLLASSLILHIEEGRESGGDLSFLKVAPPQMILKDTPRHIPVVDSSGETGLTLGAVRKELGDCGRCPLARGRRNIVFGEGHEQAQLVFVGEAPGADEDMQGLPFVGRAGQLLTKIIVAMGLTRGDVYICNLLKCRPPGNRNPKEEEIAACEPFLIKQLAALRPKVICTLGSFATNTLLRNEAPISVLRGHFHSYQGIKLMPTYHPAYLLRNPGAKKQVWEDVQMIMGELKG
ncbi:MAG: uracil-DNA glycosylase [Smithellaceae bacterium]|nr:uracil-DNA glycosylase [Smithellaceae bacterium]